MEPNLAAINSSIFSVRHTIRWSVTSGGGKTPGENFARVQKLNTSLSLCQCCINATTHLWRLSTNKPGAEKEQEQSVVWRTVKTRSLNPANRNNTHSGCVPVLTARPPSPNRSATTQVFSNQSLEKLITAPHRLNIRHQELHEHSCDWWWSEANALIHRKVMESNIQRGIPDWDGRLRPKIRINSRVFTTQSLNNTRLIYLQGKGRR